MTLLTLTLAFGIFYFPVVGYDMAAKKDDENVCDQLRNVTLSAEKKETPCILVLGMAGSGKTTFVQVTIAG